MGTEICRYCGGDGKGGTRVARVGARDEVITDPCMFCGGAGYRRVIETGTAFQPPAARKETEFAAKPPSDAAEGLASLLALAFGLFVAAAIYGKTPDAGPAVISGGIAFVVARTVLRWSPILALLRGAIWLLKAALIVAIIAVVLAAIRGQ